MSVKYNIIKVHQGRSVDEEELTLMQVSRLCRVSPECVIEMVHEGILDPSGRSVCTWHFPYASVERVRMVIRFQHDLEVNLAGAALALELLEKIERLEALLHRR
jgi:chaperone modulatory protein CbpM